MVLAVTLYGTPGCTLCRYAREDLELLAGEFPLQVREVDVAADPSLAARYLLHVPVIEISPATLLFAPFSLPQLRAALHSAQSL